MKSPVYHSRRARCWPTLFTFLLVLAWGPTHAAPSVVLTLGDLNDFDYLSDLLTRVLEQEGYQVTVEQAPNMPNNRLEWMLKQGDISVMMLGQTASRDRRFLPIEVGMTNNLIGQRILFIPQGEQDRYDGIENLDDIRERQLTAGMGKTWLDYQIWEHNDLPVTGLGGDWKRLFRMVAAGNRGVDYLPRGANEIAEEWPEYPELAVEENLVLVYRKDHILYVSPERQELYRTLNTALRRAESAGLIRQLVRKHYSEVYQPPVDLDARRVIHLELPPGTEPL
ncbi:hypothetical protein ACJO2E_15375 [Marinobacter sp. M1N3S26]|uniref:hypothetical protein n=1 Tax=unclassified Marinobacter TaxID=83889 RepID=UPI00387ABC84